MKDLPAWSSRNTRQKKKKSHRNLQKSTWKKKQKKIPNHHLPLQDTEPTGGWSNQRRIGAKPGKQKRKRKKSRHPPAAELRSGCDAAAGSHRRRACNRGREEEGWVGCGGSGEKEWWGGRGARARGRSHALVVPRGKGREGRHGGWWAWWKFFFSLRSPRKPVNKIELN